MRSTSNPIKQFPLNKRAPQKRSQKRALQVLLYQKWSQLGVISIWSMSSTKTTLMSLCQSKQILRTMQMQRSSIDRRKLCCISPILMRPRPWLLHIHVMQVTLSLNRERWRLSWRLRRCRRVFIGLLSVERRVRPKWSQVPSHHTLPQTKRRQTGIKLTKSVRRNWSRINHRVRKHWTLCSSRSMTDLMKTQGEQWWNHIRLVTEQCFPPTGERLMRKITREKIR